MNKTFTEEELSTLKSMSSYWEEILKRDEPRKSRCCQDEVQQLLIMFSGHQVMHLVNEGLKVATDKFLKSTNK